MRDETSRHWTPLSADTIFSLAWLVGPPVMAVFFAMLLPPLRAARGQGDCALFILALTVACSGVVGLAVAKYPLWRQGRFTTFGPRGLAGYHRLLYWVAYAFIVLGAFLLGSLAMALRP